MTYNDLAARRVILRDKELYELFLTLRERFPNDRFGKARIRHIYDNHLKECLPMPAPKDPLLDLIDSESWVKMLDGMKRYALMKAEKLRVVGLHEDSKKWLRAAERLSNVPKRMTY